MRLPQFVRRLVAVGSLLLVGVCLVPLALSAADDTHPVVGPGATKDDVIKAYGWPNGQSQSGTKEILNYNQGDVELEDGRVVRVNFSPDVPWQTPRPRPAAATASTRKTPEAPVDYWMTNFSDALAEAHKRHVRILALFTGSDWSPASRELHEQVEYHPDFVNAFAGDFVFVRLDFPRGTPVPATISDENLKLRDLYEVTTYPTMLVLSSRGGLLARVDLTKSTPGQSFRDRVIAAVREARDATASAPEPPPPEPPAPAAREATGASTTAAPAAGTPADAARNLTPAGVATPSREGTRADQAVGKAGRLIFFALGLGALAVVAIWWWLMRDRQPQVTTPAQDFAERIDAAAGGMPTTAEMAAWPKQKLKVVVAGLAEFDNYAAHIRPAESDIDLELRKRGDVNPRALVCCSPGSAGVVSAKHLRELYGSLATEGVENGWFVSPAGFTTDARDYAASHRIILVGSDGLHNMMREVPPVSLPAVLARE